MGAERGFWGEDSCRHPADSACGNHNPTVEPCPATVVVATTTA